MSLEFFPSQSSEPDLRETHIRIVGNGTGTPTLPMGRGCTVARAAQGDLKVTFKDLPGSFVNYGAPALQSATGTDLKQCTAVMIDWDATNKVAEVKIFDSSGTALDLSTAQSVSFTVRHKTCGA